MDEEDELAKYFMSNKFKKDMEKTINAETWEKGLPKIYMDKKGDIVEHWKDGRINILKKKNN